MIYINDVLADVGFLIFKKLCEAAGISNIGEYKAAPLKEDK